ncbi:MAG: response regulator [Elusimicrobiales bacterium]|nr:response regulator [Elusimicrobiales bacterium]
MPRVLIVDDSLFMRKILGDILSREGAQVVGEADNGQSAVDKFRELKPDVVTLDIVMPKTGEIGGGIAALREIMKLDPKARVIMVSAMGQHALVVEAIQAGARDFIVKPFQQARIAQALKKVLLSGG